MIADLLTGTLAEEISAAAELRVFIPTTAATAVAAAAARELGATGLAIANGFTELEEGQRGWVTDVFTLLRRGRLGVAVAPAQLDSVGRTNLSGIGPPGRPTVALIGPRGLPENNDTPSPLWYFLPAHSPRTLVGEVDMICGPAPRGRGRRTLLTPAGCFDLVEGGWRARWLTPGGAELVAAAPALSVEIPEGTPTHIAPEAQTLEALRHVDPEGRRYAEFGEGRESV